MKYIFLILPQTSFTKTIFNLISLYVHSKTIHNSRQTINLFMLFFKQKIFLSTNIFFHNNMNGTVFLMNIAGRLLLLRKSCVFLLLSLCLSCRVKATKLKGKHWNIQKNYQVLFRI